VENAIGVDAFLEQVRRGRTTRTTPSFALGMEAEPLRDRVKLRIGTYLEPARNLGTTFRMHGTGGLDVRVFRWALFEDEPWDFRLGFVFDIARDYTNVGLTFGFWH